MAPGGRVRSRNRCGALVSRVITVNHVRRPLPLLPAGDALLFFLARCRPHVVVEGEGLRAGRLPHDFRALRVVVPDHVGMIRKVDRRGRHGTIPQFETVGHHRTAILRLEEAGVAHRHAQVGERGTLPAGVTPVLIPPGQRLPVSKQRWLHRGVHVLEDPGGAFALVMFRQCVLPVGPLQAGRPPFVPGRANHARVRVNPGPT